MDPGEVDLAARAAWLSYIGGHTQGRIAELLGISPVKVHRLIAAAHRLGLVTVFVEGEPAQCMTLADLLMRRFGLRSCTVVPSLHGADEGDGQGAIAALGVAGARFLLRTLEQQPAVTLIGVGWGRTLADMANRLPRTPRPDMRFVSMLGSLTRKAAANTFDVVHRLAERTGGEGYFMPVPFMADSIADKEVLMAQKSVRHITALARQAQLFVIGIGDLGPEAHLKQMGLITEAEHEALRAAGAVGDLIGEFIDAFGRPVDSEVNERTLGLRLDGLRGGRVVGIAGGAGKAQTILAALRSGILTGLITDELAAARILALSNDEPHPSAPRNRRAGTSRGQRNLEATPCPDVNAI